MKTHGISCFRIVTEGIGPEQAVDEAIARVKQLLSELPAISRCSLGHVDFPIKGRLPLAKSLG
jgi:hypothetical protein